jgi:hypothetical protein
MEAIGPNVLPVLAVLVGVGLLLVVGVVLLKILRNVARTCLVVGFLGIVLAAIVAGVLLLQGAAS